MVCPKCKSQNVSVQVVSETKLKQKHHGIFWWALIGWWWVPICWLFFTLPALIVAIFRPKKYRTKTVHKSMCVCQDCGYTWKA